MPTATPKPSTARKPGRPRNPIPRARLIAVARAVFAEKGYHAATLDDIANAVGIRRASLLHRFDDKFGLYSAVLDEMVCDLRELVRTAAVQGGDFVRALDGLDERLADYLGARPGVAQLAVREMINGGPYLKGPGGREVLATLELSAAFLEAGMAAGQFVRQDPRQLTLTIVGAHLHCFASVPTTLGFLGPEAFSPAGIAERKAAILVHVRRLCVDPAPAPRKPRQAGRRQKD